MAALGPAREEQLEAYCGRVSSDVADVLLIGVAHRDGGVSERAARRLIESYQPSLCLVELDQVRFSWLVSSRRSLPQAYVPFRKGQTQPDAAQQAVRQAVVAGLETFSRAAGVSKGGGDEFYSAFEAAEECGALVVPGDLPVARSLEGISATVSAGMISPPKQLTEGFNVFWRALGLGGRPTFDFGGASAVGVDFISALMSENGGRTGPLLRSAVVGMALVLVLNLAMGGEYMEVFAFLEEGVGQVIYMFASFVFMVFSLLGAAGFSLAVWRSRDRAMADTMVRAIHIVEKLQSADQLSLKDRAAPLWCRWMKWSQTLPGTEATDDSPDALQTVPNDRCGAAMLKGHGVVPLYLPAKPPPLSPPGEAWLPVFTAKRPLRSGEHRTLSLFEPRYLALVDHLVSVSKKSSSSELAGLRLGLVHAQLGSERPCTVREQKRGDEEASDGGRDGRPCLGVEVDAVLEERCRVAEVESVIESIGADGRRRCRIRVRGTGECLVTRSCDFFSSENGALWLEKPERSSPESSSNTTSEAASHRTKVRGVAVVGLLHVNGIARYLARELAAQAK